MATECKLETGILAKIAAKIAITLPYMSLKTVATQQKYGLVKKGGVAAAKKPIAVFAGDELDEEEEGLTDIRRVNKQLAARAASISKDAERVYESAKEQDTSVFDYDGVYDSMKAASRLESHPLSRATETKDSAPKARYIANLKIAAQIREKDSDRVYERKLLKERQENEDEFKDKPQFITTAYKERLKEKQLWEYEQRLQDELDKRSDVRSRGMQGFYSNLLSRNVAVGGDVETSAVSAFTAGSKRQDVFVHGITHRSSDESGQRSDRDTEEAKDMSDKGVREDGPVDSKDPSTSKRKLDDIDDHKHSENASKHLRPQDADHSEEEINDTRPNNHEDINISSNKPSQDNQGLKEEKVLSARERYLARKQSGSH